VYQTAPALAFEVVEKSKVPWLFSTTEEEYQSLRELAGVFDHSSLGLIEVTGDYAMEFLNQVLARDVEYLTPERCLSSLVLDAEGRPIDIVTIYGTTGGAVVETAFGRGELTRRHFEQHAPAGVTISDLGQTHSVVAIEGPYAWGLIGRIFGDELTGIPYEGVIETTWENHQIRLARSGFTAEYGYKMMVALEGVRNLWEALTEQARPVGYGVLEMAMLEVRQPVLHREIDGDDTVISCGYNWLVDITRGDFVGREALSRAIAERPASLTVGFDAGPGVSLDPGARVFVDEVDIGRVVFTVHSIGRGSTIGLARLDPEFAVVGLDLTAQIDGDSRVDIRTIASPYIVPKSWSIPVI
jgi:aminomethyltransferase